MMRVLIVDDQIVFRRHLRRLLTTAGLTVVGEASTITAAKAQVEALQPDLAVVDVMLPDLTGLEGTPQLKTLAPKMRVILVSAHNDHANLFHTAAHAAGAEAFILKDNLDLGTVQNWKTLFFKEV